jgi:hypothetical protein
VTAPVRLDPDEVSLVSDDWADAANRETRRVMGVVIGPELAEYSPPPDAKHRLRRSAEA